MNNYEENDAFLCNAAYRRHVDDDAYRLRKKLYGGRPAASNTVAPVVTEARTEVETEIETEAEAPAVTEPVVEDETIESNTPALTEDIDNTAEISTEEYPPIFE